MSGERVVVQACGCIALPEHLAVSLGMLPGAVLNASPDPEAMSLTLSLVERARERNPGVRAACITEP